MIPLSMQLGVHARRQDTDLQSPVVFPLPLLVIALCDHNR